MGRPQNANALDDDTISNDEIVYRRIPSGSNPDFVRVNQGVPDSRAFTSAVFKLSKRDVDGLSVYLRSELVNNGLSASDLMRSPLNLILAVVAEFIRNDCGLGLRRDANPQDIEDADERDHPRQIAHALVTGMNELSRSERSRVASKLAAVAKVAFEGTQS